MGNSQTVATKVNSEIKQLIKNEGETDSAIARKALHQFFSRKLAKRYFAEERLGDKVPDVSHSYVGVNHDLRLIEKHGKNDAFSDSLLEAFKTNFEVDKFGREYLYVSEDSEGRDSIFLIREPNGWGLDFKGNPETLLRIIRNITKPLVDSALIESQRRFEKRQKHRIHLKLSKGLCSGDGKCVCSIGRAVND